MTEDSTTQYKRPECPNCGRLSPLGARFCSHCGFAFSGEEAADSTGAIATGEDPEPIEALDAGEVDDVPAGGAVLVVRKGPYEGARFPLTKDVLSAGRGADSDVFLDDVTVSRAHAEFLHGTEGWLVRDLGSLNGTYVNRERIDQYRLAAGDEVQIGKYRFTFVDGGVAQ